MTQDGSKVTTDPDTIRRWAEDCDGTPGAVKGTGNGEDPGILRINELVKRKTVAERL